MSDNLELRGVFDEEAELYDHARPRYPNVLFDARVSAISLQPNARLLEIGPGTGQATLPLAKRAYNITGVELGAGLADVARRNLREYENVEIITGAFEDVALPTRAYDLVYAATAFHWLRPDVKFEKPHQLLKPAGHLAIIHTEHVGDEKCDYFFRASQPIYDRYMPSTSDEPFRLPTLADLKPPKVDEQLFAPVFFKAFPLVQRYTAKQFTDLRSTYSPDRALSAGDRKAFLDALTELIDTQFDGAIEYHFAMTLAIAKSKN